MPSTFVLAPSEDGGTADPALDLARHISVLNGKDPSSLDKISTQQALDLSMENLDTIISQAGDKSTERETVEGVLNIVCYLFSCVLEGSKSPGDLVDAFVKKLAASTSHAAIRLKTMASIYNILEGNSAARYSTILAMISYASSVGKDEFAAVAPSDAALDAMVVEWDLDVAKTRALYTALLEATIKNGKADDAHALRLKLLRTFQGQAATPEALEQASMTVGELVRNPRVFQFDTYMELDAIKALQKDNAHAAVYGLLELFSKDDLKVFKDFYGKNEAVFKKLSLEKEACVLKMRLLSLCSLASRQQSIPYGDIATCLEVPEDEVEMWAIKAIQANLMDARLDQLQRCLIVNHCSSRLFSQDQWATMRVKLVGWRDRMKQLQEVIEATRARQQAELAMMNSHMQMQ